jgi:hypothetical protein
MSPTKSLLTIYGHVINLTKSSDTTTWYSHQRKYSIKNVLNSNLKDNNPPEKKSGIYQINYKDCEKIYIGKTKRNLETRVKNTLEI